MSTQKLRSYLSRLSPIPGFPEYSGPYKVGSIDVEIPVSVLDSPSPAPDAAADIHTIQFRIFYPATPDSKGSPIPWLPAPQRLNVASYTQFLGISPRLASVLSYDSPQIYSLSSQQPANHFRTASCLAISTTHRYLSMRMPNCNLQIRQMGNGPPPYSPMALAGTAMLTATLRDPWPPMVS